MFKLGLILMHFSNANQNKKNVYKIKKKNTSKFCDNFFYNNLLSSVIPFGVSSLYCSPLCLEPSTCKLSKEKSPSTSLSSSKMLPKHVRQSSTNSQVKENFHLKRSRIKIKKTQFKMLNSRGFYICKIERMI